MSRITVSVPDYDRIVSDCAAELGAQVYPIDSEEAFNNALPFAIRALADEMSGEDATEDAWSDVKARKLFVKWPIVTELGCMIAMHELGHIATTTPGDNRCVETEAVASLWALDHLGFNIGPETARSTLNALQSYEAFGPVKPGSTAWKLEAQLKKIAR